MDLTEEQPAVTVDRSRCVGHGRCYALAPDIFEPDDEGFAFVAEEPSDEASRAEASRAERNCPERAITVGQDVRVD